MSEVVSSSLRARSLNKTGYLREAASRAIAATVFYSLLIVMALTAIPYGAAEPWWKALADCLILVLATFGLIGKLLDGQVHDQAGRFGYQLIFPLLALVTFAFIQTVPWFSSTTVTAIAFPRTLSADVFQTRLFIIHLCALILAGWLLVRYTTTPRRLRHLVETIIVIGVMSAGFGLWRQTSQHGIGFVLPYLRPGFGFGQFINPNHFAFLMEMALGLTLGIAICRGVSGSRLALYLFAAVPMWVALVLANSRGGLISILCQVVFLAVLLVSHRAGHAPAARLSRIQRLALQAALVATLLIGAVATVVVVGGDRLAGRIDSLSVELDRKTAESYTLRQNIWSATWELIKDHPVSGVGFGGYWIAITRYHRASGGTTPQQAHSDYLELLASGGLIGLAIGIWFIVVFVRAAYCKVRAADRYLRAVKLGALAGIITVAVHSLVDFGLHIPVNALVCTALVALVVGEQRSEVRSQKSEVRDQRAEVRGQGSEIKDSGVSEF
jgi:O-antigen ligase